MNIEAMPLRRVFVVCLAASVLSAAGCSPAAPTEAPPLEGARIGGDFTLTGEDGRTVRWADFKGRYRIVYFGFTFCPDVCPTDLARIAQGWRQFEQANAAHRTDIAALFITVDPARDTAPVLREFTDAFDPRIVGLTGEVAAIDQVAKTFGVFASRAAPDARGAYTVEHTNVTYLFDRDGKPLATLPVDAGPDAVAAELAKWVR